jgi:hypothetical protein
VIEEVIQVYLSSLPAAKEVSKYSQLAQRIIVNIGALLPNISFVNSLIGSGLSRALYPYRVSHVETLTVIADALEKNYSSEESIRALLAEKEPKDDVDLQPQIEELASVIYQMVLRQQQRAVYGDIIELIMGAIGFNQERLQIAIRQIIDNLLLQREEVNRSLINGWFTAISRELGA